VNFNEAHRLYYAPGLQAANVEANHRRYPFNLRTMRTAKRIEQAQGCAYVSSVAGELMRQDGIEPPARGVEPGTKYSYLAYSANKARQEYATRKRHRRLVSLGWRIGAAPGMVGKKAIALLRGEETRGRLIDCQGRAVFLPGRNRANGFAADSIYLKAA
jgi:hypothetical protein